MLEEIQGRYGDLNDLPQCKEALEELYKIILHGDLNRHNIIITKDGPKFIDLEASSVKPDKDSDEWNKQTTKEMQSLEVVLADDSALGCPFSS